MADRPATLLDRVHRALTAYQTQRKRADAADARMRALTREGRRIHNAADNAIRDAMAAIGRRLDAHV